jgi:hypothetical protein
MGLGGRNAQRHDTIGVQKVAGVISADYWDFHVGQRVMTVDGAPGKVASVEDGPFPGTETYVVELENGMGGGEYRTGQLTAMQSVGTTEHTADVDYPELGDILTRRPDIARG